MDNELAFLPVANIKIPNSSSIVLLLCNQVMFSGRSPLCTKQFNDAGSPELTESSPKSNGKIWGGTVKSKNSQFTFALNVIKKKWVTEGKSQITKILTSDQ